MRRCTITIETGRYENKLLEEHKCSFCEVIKSNSHPLLYCSLYSDIAAELFRKELSFDSHFNSFNDEIKLLF